MKKTKHRIIKLIMLGIAMVLSLIALTGFILLKSQPRFYHRAHLTPEQRDAAADRAEDTVKRINQLAGASRSAEMQSKAASPPLQHAASTFTFTEDELNSLIYRWGDFHGWSAAWSKYLTDPMICLQSDRVIFAAQVQWKQINAVVSLHFIPTIDEQGRLDIQLIAVRGGSLPLPRDAVVDPVRKRVLGAIERGLPQWQAQARIDPSGIANDNAVGVIYGRLLASISHQQPADPVVFLPISVNNQWKHIAAKLTGLKLEEGKISFTVVPMDAQQRAELAQQLKAPVNLSAISE